MASLSGEAGVSPFWLAALIIGPVAFWILFAASQTASKSGDALIRTVHHLLIAFVLTTCAFVFMVVPVGDPIMRLITVWIHHTSFWMLFLFLIAAEYFQMEAWWKVRRALPIELVASSYSRLWILTEIVPAPVALVIFLTGLRLIRESPETNSPSVFWLLVLILSFSAFFWDGIFGYAPIVRKLRQRWAQQSTQCLAAATAVQKQQGTSEAVQLFLHFVSWPFVFLLGVYRWEFPNWLSNQVGGIETRLARLGLPRGWPEIATAVLLWAVMGIAVVSTRRLADYFGQREGSNREIGS